MTWESMGSESEFKLPLSPEEDTRPELTTSDEPLEIWLPKDQLRTTVQENLDSLVERRSAVEMNYDGIEVMERLIAQRREFLAWMDSYPLDHVYVQLFPPTLDSTHYGEVGND